VRDFLFASQMLGKLVPWLHRAFMKLTTKQKDYWQKNLRITAGLLVVWFIATFAVVFYARELSFSFFGWPFSFYMAAQGALIIYMIIIWFYARYMNNLDKQYSVDESKAD
jgi:putative solute:sodium symporter small subunit